MSLKYKLLTNCCLLVNRFEFIYSDVNVTGCQVWVCAFEVKRKIKIKTLK